MPISRSELALPAPDSGDTEQDALRLVARQACAHARGAAAGITVVQGSDSPLMVATSLLSRQLEDSQWASGQGPGLEAIRQLQVFNVGDLRTTSSWPVFAALATAWGVRSCLAVPIILGGRALGSLDLYARQVGAFDGGEQIGLHFAAEAALAMSQLQMAGRLSPSGPRPHQQSEAVS